MQVEGRDSRWSKEERGREKGERRSENKAAPRLQMPDPARGRAGKGRAARCCENEVKEKNNGRTRQQELDGVGVTVFERLANKQTAAGGRLTTWKGGSCRRSSATKC